MINSLSPVIILRFVLLIVIVIVVIWLWSTYNGVVTLRNRADEAWSDIMVQLKRRVDLIPNLVNTVKGYAAHEENVFAAVARARAATTNARGPAEAAMADGQLHGALSHLLAVAEAYPQLQASQNFLRLQGELVNTEDKIQAARRFYNGSVRDLNTTIQQFPTNMVAGMFGFTNREFFDVADQAGIAEAPQVSL